MGENNVISNMMELYKYHEHFTNWVGRIYNIKDEIKIKINIYRGVKEEMFAELCNVIDEGKKRLENQGVGKAS